MSDLFSAFTNQYSVSKTLRFELKPVGKTKELFDGISDGENPLGQIIEEDEERAKQYKKAKKIIDDIHRDFLNIALAKENIKEILFIQNLEKNLEVAHKAWQKQKDDQSKTFYASQKKLGKQLIELLNQNFKKFMEERIEPVKVELKKTEAELESIKNQPIETEELKGKKKTFETKIKLLKKNLKEISEYNKASCLYDKTENLFMILTAYYINDEEKDEIIRYFDGFHTYFTGFNENRANVYNIEGEGGENKSWHFLSTSIAHRLFERNLQFHFENLRDWEIVQKSLADEGNQKSWQAYSWSLRDELHKIEKEFDFSAEEFFTVSHFWRYFSQRGIDQYNEIIGGRPAGEGQEKQKGLNELINLALQKSAGQNRKKFPPLQKLHKQILSDRKKDFIEIYEKDQQMCDEVAEFLEHEKRILEEIGKGTADFESAGEFFLSNQDDKEKIFLSKKTIQTISNSLTGSWNAIINWYLDTLPNDTQKQKENKRKVFTIAELEGALGITSEDKIFMTRILKIKR